MILIEGNNNNNNNNNDNNDNNNGKSQTGCATTLEAW